MRVALGFIALTVAIPAWADDRATAEELFIRGKAAMVQRDFAHACRFLEDSYKLDPALGTLLNLAVCHKESGRVSTAWGEFKLLEGLAMRAVPQQLDRANVAREQADALYPRVSRLKILVLPSVRVPGIEVWVDGKTQAESLWDIGIPVDPGTHTVKATAPGKRDFNTSIKIADERVTETVQVLPLRAAPPGAALVGDSNPPPGSASAKEAEQVASIRAQRVAGYFVAGGGGAAIVAGSVFGVLAAGAASDAAACGPTKACAAGDANDTRLAEATSAYERGNTYGNIANIAIPLGILAVGVGVYLIVTATGSTKTKSAQLFGGTF